MMIITAQKISKTVLIFYITFISVCYAVFLIENPIETTDAHLVDAYRVPGNKAQSKIECTLVCLNLKFQTAIMVNDTQCYCTNQNTKLWKRTKENIPTNSLSIERLRQEKDLDEGEGDDGSSQAKPAKSCKALKISNPSVASGFYWIGLDEPRKVYCDQDFDEGGWMLVTNFSISQTEQSSVNVPSYSNNIADLQQVSTGKYIADPQMLSRVSDHVNIRQFRLFCIKDRVGRIVHFKSQLNSYGELFRDAIFDTSIRWLTTKTKPHCSDFLHKYTNDNSNLMSDCTKWKITNEFVVNLYRHFLYIEKQSHVQLRTGRIECDDEELDDNNQNAGIWQYYVR